MTHNKIHQYNPALKRLARKLRNNSTLAEVLFWIQIKNKAYGYQFHRQTPIDEFIIDFFCHELQLAIEIDGNTHDYNYDYDMKRQERLENLGISILRFSDIEIKKSMNDVLRVLERTISELEKQIDLDGMRTSPLPPSKGEFEEE